MKPTEEIGGGESRANCERTAVRARPNRTMEKEAKVKKFLMSTWVVIVAALVSGAYVSAGSSETKMTASLDGSQEVPLVVSTGTGTLDLDIDEDAGVIDFTLNYADLEGGNTLFAHIHIGVPGTNGGVCVFFCGGGTKPAACPNGSGTVTGTFTAADVVGPASQGVTAGEFADLINALRSRSTYANVHTVRSPGGEIRGLIK